MTLVYNICDNCGIEYEDTVPAVTKHTTTICPSCGTINDIEWDDAMPDLEAAIERIEDEI